MSFKNVAKCIVSRWFMDIAPAKKNIKAQCRYSGRPPKHSLQNASAVQLGVSQLNVVLLLYAGQHTDLQSLRLCPAQLTVGLNTSIECCCRMWLSQQSSIKENILVRFWRRVFC